MTRSIYLNPAQELSSNLTQDQMSAVLASSDGLLWVDVNEWDADNVALLRDVFAFHPLAIEDCFNDRVDTAKVDDYGNYLFVVAQSIAYVSRTERLRLVELGIFLGPNYLVTVHQRAFAAIDGVFERCLRTGRHVERGSAFLMHAILDEMVDDLLPAVEAMDEQLDNLERLILSQPAQSQLVEALLLKRNALRLRRSILSERDMVNRVSRGDFHRLIPSEALIFYRDIYDHILRVEAMIDGLRDLADGVLNSYLSAVNNRTNEIMKAMSIVAVIFLPLTLIASIFGTNLDYSPFGLTFKAGFYLMITVMLALACSLILYFKARGWF